MSREKYSSKDLTDSFFDMNSLRWFVKRPRPWEKIQVESFVRLSTSGCILTGSPDFLGWRMVSDFANRMKRGVLRGEKAGSGEKKRDGWRRLEGGGGGTVRKSLWRTF